MKPGYGPGEQWANPQARADWVNDLKNSPDTGPLRTRRTTTTEDAWADYQHRVAGPEEYRIPIGDEAIWADSVRVDLDGVTAVDAKYVIEPGSGWAMYEGGRPDFLLRDFDDEMIRYGAAIRDGSNPVARLNIITNTETAAEFLGVRARSLLGPDIDIVVTVIP